MRFGVISDTHDRMPYIVEAVKIFNELAPDAVLHCGDFVSPFSLVPFEGLKAPFYAVYGNNDGEEDGLRAMFEKNGWTLNDRPATLAVNGVKVSMLHEPGLIDKVLAEEKSELLVFGHTHEPMYEKRGGSLVVNPGEGCGWVKGRATLAIVEMKSQSVEIYDVNP